MREYMPGQPPDKPDNGAGMAKLNPRQRSFVAEFIKDKSATNAYVRAYGVSKNVAQRAGPRLLSHVGVKAEIDRLLSEVVEQVKQEVGITLERTLREIARGAFFDPRKLFREDGTPKAIGELDDDTAAVLAGLDINEIRQGGDADAPKVIVRKYKLADRKGYLDMLMKHLGGYAKDNERRVEVTDATPMSEADIARRIAFTLSRAVAAANDPQKPAAAA